MVREDGRHREEREVREVLVVDGVELVVPHQLEEVRELHRDDAVGGEQRGHAADEVVEVGHVREHVVAQQQVGSRALVAELRRQLGAEELDQRRDPAFLRRRRDVGRRLDAEDGQLALDEVLEEIAVVAGDLDDLVRRSEVEPRRSSARRTCGRARTSSARTTRSTRSRRRSARASRTRRAAPGSTPSRRMRATGRSALPDRAVRRSGRSWRAATGRGRRTTRSRAAPQNRQRGGGAHSDHDLPRCGVVVPESLEEDLVPERVHPVPEPVVLVGHQLTVAATGARAARARRRCRRRRGSRTPSTTPRRTRRSPSRCCRAASPRSARRRRRTSSAP